MITLFHGSYTSVESPSVAYGRKRLDFGPGFYLNMLQTQATTWAQTMAERKGPDADAVLNVYDFDYEAASTHFRIKKYEEYDLEWLEYVVDCRHGGKLHEAFDIVEGGVANDNVVDTVENYEKGIITAEQALGQLCYKKVNHQICILNQKVIDECLSFKACIAFAPHEDE